MTDAQGKFALEGLDPELYFQLLVYQRGFVPEFSEDYFDPREGEVTLALEPNDLDRREPERVLHGRIVDAHGDPVARAYVSPIGMTVGRGKQFGALYGVDALALSDEHGEFELGVSRAGDELLLQIDAPAFAPTVSAWLRAGEEHTVTMTRGVTVTGVVQKEGKALEGVELGLVQEDRRSEVFTGERLVGTDANGRFTFVNVPPNQAWYAYGKMATFRKHGALAARPVRLGADETTLDLGVLAVEPASKLAGRVVLSDEKPLPEGLRILIGRENAWDTEVALVAADGSFAFDGLPHELYSLDVRVSGYVLSPRNESCDTLNHGGLLGRVDGDVKDLVVLLEPGVPTTVFRSEDIAEGAWEHYEALQKSPLRGAPVEASSGKGGH